MDKIINVKLIGGRNPLKTNKGDLAFTVVCLGGRHCEGVEAANELHSRRRKDSRE